MIIDSALVNIEDLIEMVQFITIIQILIDLIDDLTFNQDNQDLIIDVLMVELLQTQDQQHQEQPHELIEIKIIIVEAEISVEDDKNCYYLLNKDNGKTILILVIQFNIN